MCGAERGAGGGLTGGGRRWTMAGMAYRFSDPIPAPYLTTGQRARIGVIATSFARLLGRDLVAPGGDVVAALWAAPQAILAHGIEEDPVFFFANRAALVEFETTAQAVVAMPSRLSAEAPVRAERDALLARVAAHGFIDDYAGVRISAKGRRFAIAGAVVWELRDAAGIRHGQAACFDPPGAQ